MASLNTIEVPEKDLPLRDDIRLLGRILGDTVREQQGEAVFAVVERIRQTSIRFHRERGRCGAARARSHAEQPVARPGHSRDPRLQLLLALGQHCRGPASYPSHPGACPRRFGTARGHHGLRARACPAGGHLSQPARGLFRHCPSRAGAYRPSNRGAAQEHDRPRDGGGRSFWPNAIASRSHPRRQRSARRRCVVPC